MAGAPLIGTTFIASIAAEAAATFAGRAARLGGVAALLMGGVRGAPFIGALNIGGMRRIGVFPRPRLVGIGRTQRPRAPARGGALAATGACSWGRS